MIVGKTCTKCGEMKLLEEFRKKARGRLGRDSACRACLRAYDARYYEENQEQVRANSGRYYTEHREEALAGARHYRAENAEKVRAYHAAYRAENAARRRAYVAANPEKARAWSARRRARAAGALTDPAVTIAALRERDGDTCSYCGEVCNFTPRRNGVDEFNPHAAHLEHLTPIARGGSHTFDNTAIACAACNLSKGAKTVEEFLGITH